ncbi:pilus assembly protein [Thauera phenylacetica]|uniref:pilus assembly protein n=1 Tax=Thauera phenylacetica TaxID=164400 RepID=UPI0039E2D3EF
MSNNSLDLVARVASACRRRKLAAWLLNSLFACVVLSQAAGAATVEIADAPIPTGGTIEVKPNVMFVLDDSGSMAWDYMPDAVETFPFGTYGWASAACNGVYYNPEVTYVLPVKADGSSYPAPSFNAAPQDGFNPNSAKVDLAVNFSPYETRCVTNPAECRSHREHAYYFNYTKPNKGPEPLEYAYSSDGTVQKNAGIYQYCKLEVGDNKAKGIFSAKVAVPADKQQNFAIWYSFYRTRINAMKSAAGRAIGQLRNPDGLRMGFSTHSDTGLSANAEFQPIGDFCVSGGAKCAPTDQRDKFFEKLYGTSVAGGTPLRSAMAKIGRMYAGYGGSGRLSQADDPVLYSCQQNFLIMATDGAWNNDANASFGIRSGDTVGDRDGGTTPRPMYDASGAANTLADIAMYYNETDLRDSTLGNCSGGLADEDVCTNDVAAGGPGGRSTQHMVSFTLGFGIDGSLKYAENYETASLDYRAILGGSKNWPNPRPDRPNDVDYNLFRIDDLWHAAVNGRGTYFSAKTPDALVSGLVRALNSAAARFGAGSGAATSSLEPVAGDNYAFVASYRTQYWEGDLQAREINVSTGRIAAEADRAWSAQAKLDEQAAGTGWSARNIYMKSGTSLVAFNSTNLRALHSLPVELTNDVIDFIRGDSSKEDQTGNTTRTLRDRTHVLGDIVSSHPVYVRRPPYKYSDSGYADFAADKTARAGIVLVGANDGMLHAFDADTGAERWAYVPAAVIPNLHKLANKDYGNTAVVPHQYYVDGSITVGDICVANDCSDAGSSDWRTIAVVGLGKGGQAYFALDITDTTAPKVLWEFDSKSDTDLGLSFGNPIITKRAGQWVVLFASGYNNESPGDGMGRLYVLNAHTGVKLSEIVADTGTDPARSGIAKISNWVDELRLDDTTRYVYAGDLSGRLWRFDLTAESAIELASFGSTQPITTRPELAEVKAEDGTRKRVIFVGTGKYLGQGDLSDASLQSIYAVRDPLGATGWGEFRSAAGVVEQVITADGTRRSITNNALDWTTGPGWFVDLDAASGERINVDFKIVSGVLTVVTNVPERKACTVGGSSYLYFFDYRTGSSVQTVQDSKVGEFLTQALAVGLSVIRVDGKEVAIINTSDNRQITVPVPPASSSGDFRRVMWRELVTEHPGGAQ